MAAYSNENILEYKDEDLATIELFKDYPESLLEFAFAFCVIFILIGIPGNLITIIALASYKKFRNATASFIINLQMCQLIFCCMILPMSATTFANKHWIFGKTMCGIYPLMKFGLNGTAHFTVVAITINRYIIVCHPHVYPKLHKRKYLIMSIISTWICGFVLFIPAIFGLWGRFALDQTGGNCTMLPDKNNICPKTFFVSLAFVAPYSFIIVCYSRIWWMVRKKAANRNAYNTRPITVGISDNELDSSALEKGPVCRELSTYESSTDNDNNRQNMPSTLTPDARHSSVINFFKKSLRKIRKEDRPHQPTSKDKKLATMIFAIIVSFTVCHMPIMLARIVYGDYKSHQLLNVLVHLLDYSSAFISPIIYVIISNEYRQAYTSLFNDSKIKIMGCFKSSEQI